MGPFTTQRQVFILFSCFNTSFVRQNRATIEEITEQQQVALFNQIYPGYECQARSVYYARTTNVQGRPEWEALHPAIRDVLVDIIYQGFRGETAMTAATVNDINSFIDYIRRTPSLVTYEPGRNRIRYLEFNRGNR